MQVGVTPQCSQPLLGRQLEKRFGELYVVLFGDDAGADLQPPPAASRCMVSQDGVATPRS
jgi:hypothetical protein